MGMKNFPALGMVHQNRRELSERQEICAESVSAGICGSLMRLLNKIFFHNNTLLQASAKWG